MRGCEDGLLRVCTHKLNEQEHETCDQGGGSHDRRSEPAMFLPVIAA